MDMRMFGGDALRLHRVVTGQIRRIFRERRRIRRQQSLFNELLSEVPIRGV
jgi:hypothetical protein